MLAGVEGTRGAEEVEDDIFGVHRFDCAGRGLEWFQMTGRWRRLFVESSLALLAGNVRGWEL